MPSDDALITMQVIACVCDDGMLGVKCPSSLSPGEYDAVVVLRRRIVAPPPVANERPFEPLDEFVERARREHVQAALVRTGGNRTQVARLLGVDARTVFRYVDKDGT